MPPLPPPSTTTDENKSIEPLDLPHNSEKFGTPHRALQFSTSTVELQSTRTMSTVTDSDAETNSRRSLIQQFQQQEQQQQQETQNPNLNNIPKDNMDDLIDSSSFHGDDENNIDTTITNNNNNNDNHVNINNNTKDQNDNMNKRRDSNNKKSIHQLLSNEDDQVRASMYIQNLLSTQSQSQKELSNNDDNDKTLENVQDQLPNDIHAILPHSTTTLLPPPDFQNKHSNVDYEGSDDLTTVSNEDEELNQSHRNNDENDDQNYHRDEAKVIERNHQPSISPLTEISVHQFPSYLNHLFPTQSEQSSLYFLLICISYIFITIITIFIRNIIDMDEIDVQSEISDDEEDHETFLDISGYENENSNARFREEIEIKQANLYDRIKVCIN